MPDYLKISDVAKIMRTTRDAIRFYEEKNIISPESCNDNRYRNFILEDMEGKLPKVYPLGDSIKVGRIAQAVQTGFERAYVVE